VLNDMTSGQVLRVVATDPGSVKDFESFSRQTGHPLLASDEQGDSFIFLLKKK
jgi:tRNA 2-thiouridine synthesizing protein A